MSKIEKEMQERAVQTAKVTCTIKKIKNEIAQENENQHTHEPLPLPSLPIVATTYEGYKNLNALMEQGTEILENEENRKTKLDTLSIAELEEKLCIEGIIDHRTLRIVRFEIFQVLSKKLRTILEFGDLEQIANWPRIKDCLESVCTRCPSYKQLFDKLKATFDFPKDLLDLVENGKISKSFLDGYLKNIKASFIYLKQAAQQRHAESLYYLGLFYFRGYLKEEGTDLNKAYQFFREAADLGHSEAQFKLAKALHKKNTVKEAMVYYHAAADQHHTESLLILAKLYENDDFKEHNDPREEQDLYKAQENYEKYYALKPSIEIKEKLEALEGVFSRQSKISDIFEELGFKQMDQFKRIFVSYEIEAFPKKKSEKCSIM